VQFSEGKKVVIFTWSLASRQAMMVAGMRPRMPPPSMLSTVMSRPCDGGGCCTVVSAVAVVPLAMVG
jgi:hypothetical protein